MDLSQIFVDLTSKNNLFNPVQAQGSFIGHRFGKRDIPEEHLDFNNLKNFLIHENPDQIILESVFGDPFEYNKIEELFDFCQYQDIQIIVLTNGVSEKIKLVEGNNSYCIFKLYGYSDTYDVVTPHGDFSKVEQNLKYCDKINYYMYVENFKDLHNVENNIHGIEVEYFDGPTVGYFINHIMTETGEWLHDVTSLYTNNVNNTFATPILEKDYDSLSKLNIPDCIPSKSLLGYQYLKTFVKITREKSILDMQLPKNNSDKGFKHQKSISYKGHLFKNVGFRDYVTNAYIPDWSIKKLYDSQDKSGSQEMLYAFNDFANNKQLI